MKDMQGDVVVDVNHLCVCGSENVRFNVQRWVRVKSGVLSIINCSSRIGDTGIPQFVATVFMGIEPTIQWWYKINQNDDKIEMWIQIKGVKGVICNIEDIPKCQWHVYPYFDDQVPSTTIHGRAILKWIARM